MVYSAVTGIFELWENQALLVAASRGLLPESPWEHDRGRPAEMVITERWAFAARCRPLYLATVSLQSDEGSAAASIAWAGSATAVITGDPLTAHAAAPNESWGDLGLKIMLEPALLETVIPGPWPDAFTVDGTRLAADPSVVPGFQARGADRFSATYDTDLAIITSWTAEIGGMAARRHVLSHLSAVVP